MTGTAIDDSLVSSICEEYRITRSLTARNKLIELHLGYIRRIARKLKRKLQFPVEIDELVSYGVIGFIDALRTFDLSLGNKLRTHCSKRVKGEMIDGFCKKHYWATKAFRGHERKYEKAEIRLRIGAHTVLTAQEVADCLEIPIEKARLVVSGALTVRNHPQMIDATDERYDLRWFPDRKVLGPEVRLSSDARFFEMLTGLRDREKVVCILSYMDEREMSQGEIAKSIGVSQAMVCLILSAALKRIRRRLVNCRFYRPSGKAITEVCIPQSGIPILARKAG